MAIILSITIMAATVQATGFCAAVANEQADMDTQIPYKTEPYSFETLVLRVLGALALVVATGYAALHGVRRFFPSLIMRAPVGSHRISVIETKRLTPKTILFLVELDGKPMLLAQNGDKVVNLDAGTAFAMPRSKHIAEDKVLE